MCKCPCGTGGHLRMWYGRALAHVLGSERASFVSLFLHFYRIVCLWAASMPLKARAFVCTQTVFDVFRTHLDFSTRGVCLITSFIQVESFLNLLKCKRHSTAHFSVPVYACNPRGCCTHTGGFVLPAPRNTACTCSCRRFRCLRMHTNILFPSHSLSR